MICEINTAFVLVACLVYNNERSFGECLEDRCMSYVR